MKSNDNRNYWQKIARFYSLVIRDDDPVYLELCNRISAHLHEEMKVLELACGSGQLSFPLSPCVKCWEATDFSENMIAQAQKKNGPEQLHFSVQDATNLPWQEESFDAVVISNALHIMPIPKRHSRKPGGFLNLKGGFLPRHLSGETESFPNCGTWD